MSHIVYYCEQSQLGQSEVGAQILLGLESNIFQLTTVGWYCLIGKSNQNYLLIQARNNPNQNLIKIVYNPTQKKINCQILDSYLCAQELSEQLLRDLFDNWFFIKIGINLKGLNMNLSYIYFMIISNFSSFSQSYKSTSPTQFLDNNSFEYLYGSQIQYPYSRSCSVSKQILAFIGQSNDSSQGPDRQTTQQEMQLLSKLKYYFDFANASSKSGQLLNLAPDYRTCYQRNYFQDMGWPFYKYVFPGRVYFDYSIDFQEENGMLIFFDVKISKQDSNSYNGFFDIINQELNLPFKTSYTILVSEFSMIFDGYLDKDFNVIYSEQHTFTYDEQHQIVCIFQKVFNLIIRQLYLDEKLILNSYFTNTSWRYLSIFYYNDKRFILITEREVEIKSFKLYIGGFFQSCNNCMININDYDCFLCQNSNNFLKLSSQYSCQNSCDYPFVISTTKTCSQGISNTKQCNIEGQDLFKQECSCPDGQYFDYISKKCQNCLYYCRTCKTPYSCEDKLYSRSYNVIKIGYVEYSNQLILAKINVVIKYVQEEVKMSFPFLTNGQPPYYNIIIGDSQTNYVIMDISDEPILFYSRIEIFKGGFYFVSYDNKDSCFIYINRSNMECIFPKNGFAVLNGRAIPKEDCNKNNQPNKSLFYYNNFTKLCQDSRIKLENCLNIKIETKQCTQCIDDKMLIQNNCQCPDGMFFDEKLKLCQKCEAQCSTCIEKSNICLTCGQGRVNPPFCNCDTNLYSNKSSDPISNPCIIKQCPIKCKKCDENTNCTQCNGDRLFPPSCICQSGFYDDPNQEFCQQCQLGYYFDQNQYKCVKCFDLCASCTGKESYNCNTCLSGLQLNKKNECVCSENLQFVQNQNICYKFMNITFSVQFYNNKYQLEIDFEDAIDSLHQIIEQNGINEQQQKINFDTTNLKGYLENNRIFVIQIETFILEQLQNIYSKPFLQQTAFEFWSRAILFRYQLKDPS
ncbi:hypothetical protein ABPG72_020288 [Tetrahymena utriculariae]